MIEVMLKKHGKVILHEICSDVQFLHRFRYRYLPGKTGNGVWSELLLDKTIPEEERKCHCIKIPEGILKLWYVGA